MDLRLVYDSAEATYTRTKFVELVAERDFNHLLNQDWACDSDPLALETGDLLASEITPLQGSYLYDFGEYAGLVNLHSGIATCIGAAATWANARFAAEEIKAVIGEKEDDDITKIPVRFWAYGPHGPEMHRRELDAQGWGMVQGNYQTSTRVELARLMNDFRPGNSGQLILWHGEPGTGKTTAIRALAQEWRDWAMFDYVTDPDKFFGDKADYMLRVMLGDEDEEKWRVLILEDAGEMIQPDAKQSQGQALSRFLNVVDGLIGQGLRIMVLLTTNEEFTSGHEAVTRHGRAAAQVEFKPLFANEASEWLEQRGAGPVTKPHILADLYALLEDFHYREEKQPVGFAQ